MIKVVSRESRIALASGMDSIVVVVVHVAVMISIHILLLRIGSTSILDISTVYIVHITHIVHIAIPMVVCDWSGILILMIKHSAH